MAFSNAQMNSFEGVISEIFHYCDIGRCGCVKTSAVVEYIKTVTLDSSLDSDAVRLGFVIFLE